MPGKKHSIVVRFSRHTFRNSAGAVTPKGKKAAYQKGIKGSSLKTKFFVSLTPRTMETAKRRMKGRDYVFKKTYRGIKTREELQGGPSSEKISEKMTEAIQKFGREAYEKAKAEGKKFSSQKEIDDFISINGDRLAGKAWLKGEMNRFIPEFDSIVPSPSETARSIIKKRIGTALRIKGMRERKPEKQFEGVEMHSISHAWILDSVFKELTGRTPRTLINENESMKFTFEGNRIFLSYRKNKYNVTKKVKEIFGKDFEKAVGKKR